MLTQIRTFLQSRRVAPLSEIALHLGVEPDVARSMLERWMRKGQVVRIDTGQSCGGCEGCGVGALEIYRWCGNGGDAGVARCH